LEPYISYIVSATEVTHAKPDPEPVLTTLQALGVKARDAMVVGDTTFDILMGQRAGTKTCGVTYGNGTREQMTVCRADYLIDDFAQLLDIV
jgi:phosphoglycolate phosphatase